MAGTGETRGGHGSVKAALRARVRDTRAARSPAARQVASDAVRHHVLALPEAGAARTVAAYVSLGSEVGTDRLLADLHASGSRVLLPVVLEDLDLDWAVYGGPEALVRAARGLREPVGHRLGVAAVTDADLVLVPAVAADPRGHRLGRGGGSYDRALARVAPHTPVVALLFEDEVLDEVPAESHDRPVSAVVTPGGVLRVRRAAGGAPSSP